MDKEKVSVGDSALGASRSLPSSGADVRAADRLTAKLDANEVMRLAETLVMKNVANAQYVWEQRMVSPALAAETRAAYIELQNYVYGGV